MSVYVRPYQTTGSRSYEGQQTDSMHPAAEFGDRQVRLSPASKHWTRLTAFQRGDFLLRSKTILTLLCWCNAKHTG